MLVGSGGDFVVAGSGSLSWSLGEIVTSTETNAPNTLTQGFQQVDRSNVSVDELFQEHISVYPVPFQTSITISYEALDESFDILVYASNGQLAYSTPAINAISGNLSLDLSSLEPGIYVLTLENQANGEQFFRRIIKT